MENVLNKKQVIFSIIIGLYSVWAYYNFLGAVLVLLPLTYFIMPIWLFTAGIHAKGIVERGEANTLLKYVYGPLVVLVVVIDVVWNITIGSLVYKELPREWLFTTRTKRHITESEGAQFKTAAYWAEVLNAIDPGHV